MKTLSELLKEQITDITDDKLNLTEANAEESRVISAVSKDVQKKSLEKTKSSKSKMVWRRYDGHFILGIATYSRIYSRIFSCIGKRKTRRFI